MSRGLRIGASALLAAAAVAGALLFFQSRDESTLEPRASAVGRPYRGEPVLSPALEDAVANGNVVVLHRDARPPAGTERLQEGAGPELQGDGLAVLLEREPTLRSPLAAVSADRIETARRPGELRAFVDLHLGRAGAP